MQQESSVLKNHSSYLGSKKIEDSINKLVTTVYFSFLSRLLKAELHVAHTTNYSDERQLRMISAKLDEASILTSERVCLETIDDYFEVDFEVVDEYLFYISNIGAIHYGG